MRRHGVFSPLPHAHNLFTQFNLTLALPNSLSSSLPPSPPLSCPRLHWMIFTAKYVRVRLTNIRCFFLTYVTQDGILTAFSHPLPSSNMEPANIPYASCTTSYPRQQHDTFAFLPLFSISTLIKKKWCLPTTNRRFQTTHHHRPHPWDTHHQFSIKTLLSKTFLLLRHATFLRVSGQEAWKSMVLCPQTLWLFFFFWWIFTISALIISGMHTAGGAVEVKIAFVIADKEIMW